MKRLKKIANVFLFKKKRSSGKKDNNNLKHKIDVHRKEKQRKSKKSEQDTLKNGHALHLHQRLLLLSALTVVIYIHSLPRAEFSFRIVKDELISHMQVKKTKDDVLVVIEHYTKIFPHLVEQDGVCCSKEKCFFLN